MANLSELTDYEKCMIDYAKEGNFEGLNRLLTKENILPNCFDEDGMTPLMHAAYAGHFEVCKLLLDNGADVNATRHKSEYSCLMFAGLGGKLDVVSILLDHGALINKKNNMNKTAAQMSAFVGNQDVVKLLNNFISLEEVEEFSSSIKGLENMSVHIHKMAFLINLHPVRLVMYIQQNVCILEKTKEISQVFNILSEKSFMFRENEWLSLKFHHIAYILKVCQDFILEKTVDAAKSSDALKHHAKESLTLLIKYWIKGDKNGFPIVLEKLLRQSIAEYPFKDNDLFKSLIRTLGPVKLGEEPSAIWIIGEVTNNQRGQHDKPTFCATCGELLAAKKCSKCKSVYYCDAVCQKMHWFAHKVVCSKLFEKFKGKETESSSTELPSTSSAGVDL